MSGRFDKDIVTEIKPATEYYLATVEHQQYFEKKGQRSHSLCSSRISWVLASHLPDELEERISLRLAGSGT